MASRINELLEMKVRGNAGEDKPLFDLAHTILMDESETTENKMAALAKIDEAMGLGNEPAITPFDVDEYTRSFEPN